MVEQVILGLRNKLTGEYVSYVPKTAISKNIRKVKLSKGKSAKTAV